MLTTVECVLHIFNLFKILEYKEGFLSSIEYYSDSTKRIGQLKGNPRIGLSLVKRRRVSYFLP